MKKYILFDLDGTLTDPKEGITKGVRHALTHFGKEVKSLEELIPFIGPPLKTSFMTFYGLGEEESLVAIAKYREYFGEIGIFENGVYDGVREMLGALKAEGYSLILATSKPVVYAKRILDHFDLTDYFAGVCGSELDGTRSQKGEVITYAMTQNQITSKDWVMMVGDRKHDVIGAKENGIPCIGVLFGYGDRQELTEAGATYIVSTVAALKQLLLAL